jgi:hypothetical protein
LIPKKIKVKIFPADFLFENYRVVRSRYAANPLIVALSPGHSHMTRFCPYSPIAAGNHFYRAKKFQILLRLATLTFLIGVQVFRDLPNIIFGTTVHNDPHGGLPVTQYP